MSQRADQRAARRGAAAFSLLELLVVLFIIALVVAILFPVLGGARQAAQRAATLSQIQNLTQASKQFELDNRRLPGYFAPDVMGASANATRGFTQMQNIMLDLAGGITSAATGTAGVFDQIGPNSTGSPNNVKVDIGQIGAPTGKGGTSSKSYYAPDRASLVVQDKPGQVVAGGNNVNLPHVLDAFGTPLLAWAQDESVTISATNFAATDTSASGGPYAFYWAQNAGILSADSVGKRARAQRFVSTTVGYSLLGAGRSDAQRVATMRGVLGHPSYPLPNVTAPEVPASALGKVIFHSAGADGFFLGSEERGGKLAQGTKPPGTAGAPQYSANVDNKVDFDDLIIGAGN